VGIFGFVEGASIKKSNRPLKVSNTEVYFFLALFCLGAGKNRKNIFTHGRPNDCIAMSRLKMKYTLFHSALVAFPKNAFKEISR
jgi:hypothetical protein